MQKDQGSARREREREREWGGGGEGEGRRLRGEVERGGEGAHVAPRQPSARPRTVQGSLHKEEEKGVVEMGA